MPSSPITERDLESVLPKSRFAVYGTKEWEKARSIFKDDFDFSKEKEKSSFFLFEIVDGHYGRWGETLVVCEESKRRPGDKEQRDGYICNSMRSLKDLLSWIC